MGWGALIIEKNRVIHRLSEAKAAAPGNTNNVAEYLAINAALDWLLSQGFTNSPVEVYGDSKLVIEQCSGRWKVKKGAYAEVARATRPKIAQFRQIKWAWIPRERNTWADALSTRSLAALKTA